MVLSTLTKRFGAGSIPSGGAIFGQYIGSISINQQEELGKLLICSDNSNLERQRLGDSII